MSFDPLQKQFNRIEPSCFFDLLFCK